MNKLKYIDELINGRLILRTQSDSAIIEIRQRGSERILLYNGITFSRIYTNTLFTKGYWDYLMPLPRLFSAPSVLVLGLGGGTIPYQLESLYRDIKIDAVEIDPNMVHLVDEFLPKKLNASIKIEDGSKYIKNVHNAYDLIIMDTYVNAKIPDVFLNEEFIGDAYAALKNKGILAVNFALTSDNSAGFWNYVHALERFFKVGTLTAYNLGNKIIVCMKGIDKEELDRAVSGFESKQISRDYLEMEIIGK